MAQESMTSPVATPSPAEVHKGSGVAVESGKWYIAECKPTKERVLRTMLQRDDYEVYVASQKQTRVYASRNRREVERIVMPGKLFVRTTEDRLWPILLTYSSIHRFMINRLASDRDKAKRVFAYVSNAEMEALQYVLNNADKPVHITTSDLVLGQRVEVMRGPLIGLKGDLARIDSATYIVLKMEMGERHYIFTEISIDDIQPL